MFATFSASSHINGSYESLIPHKHGLKIKGSVTGTPVGELVERLPHRLRL
jgi:hypothetical protein